MGNCCICGSKLGFLKEGFILSYGCSNLEICEKCNTHKNNLEVTLDIDDLSGMLASRKYFQECLQLGTVQEGAVEKLKSMLEESIRKEAENREYHIRKQEFKITTGYNFEKFDIVDYKDIISAEVVLGTGIFSELNAQISDLFGTNASEFEGKIAIAKAKAMENLNEIRLGFVIVDDEKRGQGYGKEMISLAVQYAFDFIKVNKISLGVFENNSAAIECYKSCGFKIVKLENVESYHCMGEVWNCVEMELVK